MPTHTPAGSRPAGAWLRPLLLLLALAADGVAQDDRFVVATKEAAPFAFRDAGGRWTGLSIELWRGIADDLGIAYEFEEAPLPDLIDGLTDGRFDASVAALTLTPEREARVDFTHAFYPSGLGVAVRDSFSTGLTTILGAVFSVSFLQAVATLLVVLFLGGVALWFFERRRNAEQFGGPPAKGLGSALWWSAVTMTTVGYGDKAPKTAGGRSVAIVWMFISVVMLSGLTAAIASTLTVSRLENAVAGPGDLPSLGRLACVRGTTGEDYLQQERLPHTAYDDVGAALDALVAGRARAVVYDAPILRYLAFESYDGGVDVLPFTFERQDYSIALPLDSPRRKSINRALLERVSSEAWDELLHDHLGADR